MELQWGKNERVVGDLFSRERRVYKIIKKQMIAKLFIVSEHTDGKLDFLNPKRNRKVWSYHPYRIES